MAEVSCANEVDSLYVPTQILRGLTVVREETVCRLLLSNCSHLLRDLGGRHAYRVKGVKGDSLFPERRDKFVIRYSVPLEILVHIWTADRYGRRMAAKVPCQEEEQTVSGGRKLLEVLLLGPTNQN
jgi:hypothetical protein